MLVVSILVFLVMELDPGSVAQKVLGPYSNDEQRRLWMEANGYLQPLPVRYVEWLAGALSGDFGMSTRFKVPVTEILMPRLANTRSEEHTSELQSLMRISYAVFCLKKKTHIIHLHTISSTQL